MYTAPVFQENTPQANQPQTVAATALAPSAPAAAAVATHQSPVVVVAVFLCAQEGRLLLDELLEADPSALANATSASEL